MSRLRALGIGKGLCALVCAMMVLASTAVADISDYIVEFTAGIGNREATLSVPIEEAIYVAYNGRYTWELAAPFDFEVDGIYLGTLETAFIEVCEDPEVNLNFSVLAGPDTTRFHIASALLSFPTMDDAEGRASAAYTLTDFNGDGATMTGIGDTGGAYLAQYNGWAGDPVNGPQGTTFAEGIYLMEAGPYLTVDEEFNEPETGHRLIPDPVYDMSSLISFHLSAFDLASGTSHYEIVPEPGSLAVLALGGLALLRRRS